METLIEIAKRLKIKTDKYRGSHNPKGHTYLEEYENLFQDYKNLEINILEIGVCSGNSLKLWAEAFPKAKIYGIDVFKRTKKKIVENLLKKYDNVFLHTADSVRNFEKSIKQRQVFFDDIGDELFHIIIDDGDHKPKSQLKTFNNFKHLLHSDGKYIIEDVWGWDGHNKNCTCSDTSIDYLKNNISNLQIIDMNDDYGIYKDNVLAVYKN
jgi:hypothetical protein